MALVSMVWPGVAQAEESVMVSVSFAGSEYADVGPDSNGDGILPSLAYYKARGSPGAGNLMVGGEFGVLGPPVGCPEGYEARADMVASTGIGTFNDLSTVTAVATSGFVCLDLDTFTGFAESEGIFVGGTGRFEGASGTWTSASTFAIFPMLTQGSGTIQGEIILP